MKHIEDTDLLQALLPSSISGEPVFQNAATALTADDDTKGHLDDALFYARLDELSGGVLDHLAAQWQARVWRDTWSDQVKRDNLRSLIRTKSRLGTRGAVTEVLQAVVGGNATIKEWWETDPPGVPHTFEITVNQALGDARLATDALEDLLAAVDYAKPVRSQYTLILVNQPLEAQEKLSTVLRGMSYTRLVTGDMLWSFISTAGHYASAARAMAYAKLAPRLKQQQSYPVTLAQNVQAVTANYVRLST